MLSYRYWFLGKLRTAFYWTKIWRKVTSKFGLLCWGTAFGKFVNIKDSLVNKLFSYHPSGVWQIFITGMYYYLGVQMPSSDIIFGWELPTSGHRIWQPFFWLNLLSGLRTRSLARQSPSGVEGGGEASCGISFSLCFGNISRKDHRSGSCLRGTSRGSSSYTAWRKIGRTSGNHRFLLWVGSW